LRKIQYFDSI